MNMIERRASLVKQAKTIADNTKAAGRDFTSAELSQVQGLINDVKELDVDIKSADASQALLRSLGDFAPGMSELSGDDRVAGSKYMSLSGKGAADLGNRLASKMLIDNGLGVKALLPNGEAAAPVAMLPNSPLALGKVPANFLDVLPVKQHPGSKYAYLRQAVRTNNAAAVAMGGTKPTSIYGLTRIDGELSVIAHLSEPIDKYWLEDSASLQQFIQSEMAYGLLMATEGQALNGNGTPPNLRGLLNVVGIQTQAALADSLLTIRAAITKVETVGHTPEVLVMNPLDWQAIETQTDTQGRYMLDASPINRAARKLWGVQVVVSTALTAKTSVLFDTSAVALDTDSQGVSLKWSENVSDDFAKNQVRARLEGRFGLSVYQPTAVVKITLPA